jgi:hypothetical protein
VYDDDRSGLRQQCVRSTELQNYGFGRQQEQ